VKWLIGICGVLALAYVFGNSATKHVKTDPAVPRAAEASAVQPAGTPVPPPPTPPAANAADDGRVKAKELYLYGENAEDKKDIKGAIDLFEKACAGGEIMGCAKAGYWYAETRKGVRKNYGKAFTLDTTACDADIAMACNNLGVLNATGRGVAKNWSQAAACTKRPASWAPRMHATT
jgi:TPR repeat protein